MILIYKSYIHVHLFLRYNQKQENHHFQQLKLLVSNQFHLDTYRILAPFEHQVLRLEHGQVACRARHDQVEEPRSRQADGIFAGHDDVRDVQCSNG